MNRVRYPLVALITLSGLAVQGVCWASPQARTAAGVAEGVSEATSGLSIFRGIPFAAPPIGALRWREPQPVKNWSGVRKADKFSARCMQRPRFSDMVFRSNGVSEDCLYLNVWTSAKSPQANQPVLVYFYGGGFVAGDGSEFRYDGASMARRGITTVTVNYRLDVFGMLAHPWLTAESPHHASGNYGLLDQYAALQWVQRNIAAFGGDPKRVTIAGESAGSIAVSALMASPLSRGLFSAAIGESGSMLGRGDTPTRVVAEKNGAQFAKLVDAKSLDQLRAVPAETLLQVNARDDAPRLDMIVDGYFLSRSPAEIYSAGEQAHVPLLAGSNSQEAGFENVLDKEAPTVKNYTKALKRLFSDKADRVFRFYPAATNDEVMQSATELASDRSLGYSTWLWVETHGKTGGRTPTFYYYFSRARPVTVANPSEPAQRGAVHSGEIEYAMGNLATNKVYAWTADDYKVSEIMQSYFANFVAQHDPNGSSLPQWDAYNRGKDYPRMTIDVKTRLENDARRPRYALAEELTTDE